MKATVVIPTKNPGPNFRRVLERVCTQDCPWPFEVVIIDSGSTDGTPDLVRDWPGVRLSQIAPAEFGHGRTRNLGASMANGEFVAFLTHDALPADRQWLARIVAATEQAPDIAGAFGRHIAYPDASAFTKRDLERHFAGFEAHPHVVSRQTDPERYDVDQGWRQFLHFFSSNNACVRRSVWARMPFPDVEFAEDQIWAHRIIEAGYAKAYAPDAVVHHSHDYAIFERFQRAFDESNAFRVLFGYRLNASPVRAVLSIGYLARRDLAFAWRQGIGPLSLGRRLCLDIALVGGQMVGAHAARLPDHVRASLSRDKQLQRSLPVAGTRQAPTS
jgi:glycosyltransferase involved in cell wall biosynthesis